MKRNVDLIPTVIPCFSLSIRIDFFTNKTPWTLLDGYVYNYFACLHTFIPNSYRLYNKILFSLFSLTFIPHRVLSCSTSWSQLMQLVKERSSNERKCNISIWQCHPTVTKRKDSKFHHWHASWVSKNGTDIQHRLCQDWLMGRWENLIPHRTRVITDNDQTRSPYRQYNRFRVERLQPDLLTETCV